MNKFFLSFVLLLSFACSSSEEKDPRPYEIFEPPNVEVLKKIVSSKKPAEEKKILFDTQVEKIELDWESRLSLKRKKFASFLEDSKSKFAKSQIEQRDQFVKERPSREMLGSFLSNQAADQRAFYKKSITDEDYFKRNEEHLSKKFEEFISEQKKKFGKKVNKKGSKKVERESLKRTEKKGSIKK